MEKFFTELTKFAHYVFMKQKQDKMKRGKIKVPKNLQKSYKAAKMVIPIQDNLYSRIPTKEECRQGLLNFNPFCDQPFYVDKLD